MYATLPDTNYSPPNAHLASLNNSIYVAVIVRSTICRITPTESLSIIFQQQSVRNYLLSYTSRTHTLYNTHTHTPHNTHTHTPHNARTHTLIHSIMSTPTHYNSHTNTSHNARTHTPIHSIMSTPTHYNSRTHTSHNAHTHTSHNARTHTSYNAESRHRRMGHCAPGGGGQAGEPGAQFENPPTVPAAMLSCTAPGVPSGACLSPRRDSLYSYTL